MSRTIYKITCALLLLATSAHGQSISVVVLNAKNGRALRNAVVWAQFYEPPGNRVLQRLQFKTGPDGVAHIQLAPPLPVQITLSASADPFYASFMSVAAADVVNHGASCQCDPKAKGHARTAKPGEVVFLVCRIPWWVRLLAPLESE